MLRLHAQRVVRVVHEFYMNSSLCPRQHWLRFILIVASAPFLVGQGSAPITLYLSHLRTQVNAGQLLEGEPNLHRRIIRVSGWKIIHCLKAALSSNQA